MTTPNGNPQSGIHDPQFPTTRAASDSKRGVIIFNLGGPETLDDVRPFLYNLFSDPDIIRIKNDFLRRALAWSIASTRQYKSRGLYRQIGGGSPLRKITEGQAAALQARLAEQGFPARVYVGMRCWKPSIDDALENALRDGVRQLLALPLFPQYSVTTTGSCFNYLKKLAGRKVPDGVLKVIYADAWYQEPRYIEAMADMIREALGGFAGDDSRSVNLLYSAHSIPARYVDEGDPYLDQVKKSVELINARLSDCCPSTLSFQSRVGPVQWLEPATNRVLAEFGRRGIDRVLVVPISFVSDHIETLQEIDILYRQVAADSGIKHFGRAPSLNLNPKFIDALAQISLRHFKTV